MSELDTARKICGFWDEDLEECSDEDTQEVCPFGAECKKDSDSEEE
jgi:hypothetical protein